jgi:integrase/ribosomal protein L40E
MRFDIHNKSGELARTLERIKESKEITERNKIVINDFYNFCVAQGLSLGRILSYVALLMRISLILKKDFESVNRDNIINLVQNIESKGYSLASKRDYKITLKKFYKWLRKTDEYPEEVKWIKSTIRNHKFPEELLTQEEVKKLIEVAKYPRDKAFIFVLYDSGCRIGEIASLRLKDVNFDEYGAILMVDGKTGMRRVRLLDSTPSLANWIENHPYKDDPEAPLWTSLKKRTRKDGSINYSVNYECIRSLLKRLKENAGINKRIYPHLFRHSRATEFAKLGLNEPVMKEHFGWTRGSNMPSVYVHLSGRDTDDAILRVNGIKKNETEENDILKPKKCFRCNVENPATAKFCYKCGAALDLKTVVDLEDKRKETDGLMNLLVQDPDVQKILIEKIEKLGLRNKIKEII